MTGSSPRAEEGTNRQSYFDLGAVSDSPGDHRDQAEGEGEG